MLTYLYKLVRSVGVGISCAAHNCTYEEYVSKSTSKLGIIGYTKKYPLRVKMIVAPIVGALFGIAYFYKVIPMMYALAVLWYVWGFVGDYLTARRNFATYSPLIKKFIESSLLLKWYGVRHIAYAFSIACVFAYSFICTLIGTAAIHVLLA